jgi:hypothetical protein
MRLFDVSASETRPLEKFTSFLSEDCEQSSKKVRYSFLCQKLKNDLLL